MRMRLTVLVLGLALLASAPYAAAAEDGGEDSFTALLAQRAREARERRAESPLTRLSTDFFARFSRDPEAAAGQDETAVEAGWRIVHAPGAAPVVGKMAGHLAEFLQRCMAAPVTVETSPDPAAAPERAIVLRETGGGRNGARESFTVRVRPEGIEVAGADPGGLRSGVVRLIGLMGLRQAPFLPVGETVYTPRVGVRQVALGGIPNDIFYGGNAVTLGSGDLYGLSTSDAIPELAVRRNPAVMQNLVAQAERAREYGMGMYVQLSTVHKFAKDDPLFDAYPDIRGALTWKADGDYTLCTEHPLVRQYIMESVEGLFRAIPDLDGVTAIIGGESFYHCFMRAYGAERGHTNCARCEPLGAEQVVANLCNAVAEAARRVNPDAQVIAWPYSASHVWSADWAQAGFMRLLGPGVAILTEMEKDEVAHKPGGIAKSLWDYSIDMIGPGNRAATQLAVGRETGVPVHILSMAEMSFEAPLLPFIPVLDRWAARAEALAASGAAGVYLWNMAPFDGLSSGECYQYKWFDPAPSTESLLQGLAARIAGNAEAGALLRLAWREASNGFGYTPAIGSYYKGAHYLGPAHPVVIDPDTEIPAVFDGYYLFLMEITRESGMQAMPTYELQPEKMAGYFGPESLPLLELYHRVLQDHLRRAVDAVDAASPLVPERARTNFEAETLPIRWFHHTARTQGNLFEAARLGRQLRAWAEAGTHEKAGQTLARLRGVLFDEQENTREALPVAQADPRVETVHRGDHSFHRILDMLEEKVRLLDRQMDEELPALAARLGVPWPPAE